MSRVRNRSISFRIDRARAGFTFVEAVAAMVVIVIVALAALTPLHAASDNAVEARDVRVAVSDATHALDRLAETFAACPAGAAPGTLAISSASATQCTFTDTSRIEFVSGQLTMRDAAGVTRVLCESVDECSIAMLAEDGVTSTLSSPASTHTVVLTVRVGDVELSSVVLPRVRMVP